MQEIIEFGFVFIWVIYLFVNLYLNIKIGELFFPKSLEIFLFTIPLYIILIMIYSRIYYFLFKGNILLKSDFSIGISTVIGSLMMMMGIMLILYCIFFEKNFHAQKFNLKELGIYKFVTHPSYIMFIFLTFGASFVLSDYFILLLSMFNAYYLKFAYKVEEREKIIRDANYAKYIENAGFLFPQKW